MESWEMCSEAAGEAENDSDKKTKQNNKKHSEGKAKKGRFKGLWWTFGHSVLLFSKTKRPDSFGAELSSGVTHVLHPAKQQ